MILAAAVSGALCMGTGMVAWAEEAGTPGADTGTSRVIVCGAAEKEEEVKLLSPGSEESEEPDGEVSQGPSGKQAEKSSDKQSVKEDEEVSGRQGASLGMFITTGYCTCEKCSGGSGLTYSGTVPQANHTISADLELYPIGTRLMIGGTIYTVEDMGSSIKKNRLDIYYGTHEEAVAHGVQTLEVFAVEE